MTDQNTVDVPGSGRLTDEERTVLARVHTLVPLTPDTMMFQVLPPGGVRVYLSNAPAVGEVAEGERTDDSHSKYGRLIGMGIGQQDACPRRRALLRVFGEHCGVVVSTLALPRCPRAASGVRVAVRTSRSRLIPKSATHQRPS
jgi:hypothetical protein